MGHCSIRSLLFAAIVISNCITWTATRHHYTHNVHGHRSRHRRQGAGLFLPSSHVLPGGQGGGAWGEWGPESPCSRTCGGGVASRKRICLEIGPDGRPNCSGGDTKYFSCATQDCPEGSQDFRAEQCSQYDDVSFNGIKYTWVPYTKGPNPCELNCMPRGERFYYRHQKKVVDGTRCNEESFDVCVDGTCQPVGCDFMLGSSAREDKCRVCRGNGTNCHSISDLLDTQDLRNGYNDILLIPKGATSIFIEEVRPSTNYLAIRATNNTYYLNGGYQIDFPRSIVIAGVTWHYERSQHGLPAPDKLRCLGPTEEPLFLSILLQEPNVGVHYEYSIPQEFAPPPNQQYNWVHEEFTPCSATCGGGFQTRSVSCRSREELEVVDEGLCNEAFKPATNRSCNTEPCAASWVEGPWGPCSKPCGEGGSRSRQVHCEKIITNGYPSVVADEECFKLLGPKPPLFEKCNENATCPMWFTGPWKPCDKLCDEGKQTRQVVCYQKNEGKIEVLDDKACQEERPESEQACMIHPCEGVDWMVTDWVGCDTCLSTVRTRSMVCATTSFQVVNDSFCAYHAVPPLEEPCDKSELPGCDVQWYATQWSNCSAECGKGVQTRRVFCGLFDGESVVKVNDSRCDPLSRYNDTKPCEVTKCPTKWYAGPWSECSAKCGGGEQERRVTCLDGDEEKAKCDPDTVLDSTQSCNTIPCDEDEMLPVGPNSTPIMDDYDDECEDYPELAAEEDSSLTTLFDEMLSDSPSTEDFGLESEFVSGSGSGSLPTDSSSFGYTDSMSTTDISLETEETGSGETSESPSSITDESSIASESTVVEDTASTDLASPGSTESMVESSTSSDVTESTVETSSGSDYDYVESTSFGSTESTESTMSGETESSDGSTPTEKESKSSEESSEPTESGATEASRSSDETTESGSTESSATGVTESTLSSGTDSGSTDYTDESTESDYTNESTSSSTDETATETTESSPTETSSESSTSSESDSTDVTTESGATKSSGSTESTEAGSTESATSESSVGSTDSGSSETEFSGTTESGSTESTVSAETGSTESSGSTESAHSTVSGLTESESTEASESSTTESSEATESESSSDKASSTESGSTEPSGSTESGATEISGSTETTEAGSTESSESTDSTVSGSSTESETGSTESTSESATEETGSTFSTEESSSTESGSTESSTVSGEETTVFPGTTPYDWASTVEKILGASGKRQCRPRIAKCVNAKFGCCPDKRTPAKGPFDKGCPLPKTCAESQFGCCPDGVSPALGPKDKGCPVEKCAETLFGCCKSDNKTPAEGNDQEGCPPPPPPCKSSKYGCCKDEKTQVTGPNKEGCPEAEKPQTAAAPKAAENVTTVLPPGADCNSTEFGCCPDGVSPAAGAHMEGCVMSCNSSAYGCCPDGETPAHGYDYEGCCLLYPYGCCPDNFKPAEGPHLEGCGCQYSHFGCCPDNVTLASGPGNEGCGCEYTDHGCCPDRHTAASGPEYAGCDCHTFQFGCCEDGVTTAKGPGMQGCLCQQSEFGCCGDEKTPAVGPDQAGCDCSTSKYGCCPDGETAAQGSKFLGCTDKREIRQAACALSTDRGSCSNYSVYWYYDMQYGGCSRFWYGGCEGNGNRFVSKEECEDVCVNPAPKDACNLPMVKGACEGYHLRWYYDAEREHCSQFIFGGCLGNANNHVSRELCQEKCEPFRSDNQCSMPIERGSCAGNFLRWGWSAESERCEQFIWGGCEGNSNRFSSEAACLHRCNPPGVPKPQCKEPLEAGNCTEKHALWAFNQPEDRCVPFYYTGCGGNDNRFDSRRSCDEACPKSYVKSICTLPAVTGECAKYTEKWYYDTTIKRCRQFYYGGCGGNENRFSSEMECESQCSELKTTTAPPPVTTPADVCTLPSMTGDCDNYKEKWFFDSRIGSCRQFYYGGCGGNDNRFDSEPACQARCSPARTTTTTTVALDVRIAEQESEICFMSMDPGPCAGRVQRWAYDAALGECVTFTYGDCGGNQNNFPDKDYCELICGAAQDVCQLPMISGSCDDSIMQWFYDASSDSCSQFAYSGCGGNPNRFASLEACEQRCRSAPGAITTLAINATTTPAPASDLPPACRILPEANEECVAEGQAWYLDPERHACVFHSNPASGNSCRRTGTHPSEEACERACGAFRNLDVCRHPKDAGPCRADIPKFYYDEALDSCRPFGYGGCHGGPNRFSSMHECENVCKFEKDPCKRIPQSVNCVDYLEAWFFDVGRGECYQYGVCDPSYPNRLASRVECEQRCLTSPPETNLAPATPAPPPPQPSEDEECATPRSFEDCDNSSASFYYDAERSACVANPHGQCSHANSHGSEEECERRCGAFRGLDPCRSQLDVGGCNSAIPKFYWKLGSGRCEPFSYSGCGGGPNRFSSVDECEAVCSGTGPEPACLEPVDGGAACGAPSRRWRYDERAGHCLPFVYRGCGGSRNNFRSPGACARACHRATIDFNEVLPDCDRYNEECARLRCEFGVQRTRGADGCERCACVQVEVDCAPLVQECEVLKCTYGVKRTMAPDGCERCTCYEHPCAGKECPAGERCVNSPFRDPITLEIGYTTDCRVVNKTGSCPPEWSEAEEAGCRRECNDDADCVGVGKCCARGCSQRCREPAAPSSAAPPTTTYAPELPQAPQANSQTEPEVVAKEGGKATLRCLFHGNPPPVITWRRGEITIDGAMGRYRVLSDGALEIVSLYRNDSGVYICIGENLHGSSRQEVRLQVNDPVESPAGISGDADAVVAGELGRSLNIRCLAYGHPPPSIYWYRGRTMLPYSSEQYEARENVLQIRRLEEDTLGEYACQAFNGVGKPAVWSVRVEARQPPAGGLLGARERTVEITPPQPRPTTSTSSTPAPEIDMPVYTVAVNTNIPFEQTTLAVGSELSLPCDVDGYPLPEVYWTKDNARLAPDARTQITDARLTISGLKIEDSGVYGCHARNEYSYHSSTIQINVQGVVIPVHCTDNPFFADCKLIVQSKFCNHQYYSRFCCASCVKDGQLNALELQLSQDEPWTKRK